MESFPVHSACFTLKPLLIHTTFTLVMASYMCSSHHLAQTLSQRRLGEHDKPPCSVCVAVCRQRTLLPALGLDAGQFVCIPPTTCTNVSRPDVISPRYQIQNLHSICICLALKPNVAICPAFWWSGVSGEHP